MIRAIKTGRTCVGCRKVASKTTFLGIVRTSTGFLVACDFRYPPLVHGRTIYLCPEATCIDKAKSQRGNAIIKKNLKCLPNDEIWSELLKLVKDGK